jgi:hypothetical protein
MYKFILTKLLGIRFEISFLKPDGNATPTKFNSNIMEQKLKIKTKLIKIKYKKEYDFFIKSINNRIPYESEITKFLK